MVAFFIFKCRQAYIKLEMRNEKWVKFMEKTSFREYIASQGIEKAAPKRKKWSAIFATQVVIAMILGGIIWFFISSGNEQAINSIANNVKYDVQYSDVLQEVENVWVTIVR